MKNGFALINLLIILVLMSGLLSLTIKISKNNIVHTKSISKIQNAKLFLNSSIELAILGIQGYVRNNINFCAQTIDVISEDGELKTIITIKDYLIHSSSPSLSFCDGGGLGLSNSISTLNSNGTVIMDIETTSLDGKIRITKKVVQKI